MYIVPETGSHSVALANLDLTMWLALIAGYVCARERERGRESARRRRWHHVPCGWSNWCLVDALLVV